MIQADIFYTAKCDRCHRTFNEAHGGLEVTHFPDAGEAKDYAISNDWFEHDGKHYCPDCLIETDEDPIVKPDYPRWVWDVKSILESTIAFCKTFVYIEDMDDAICFKGYLKGKDIPNQSLIETIIDTEVVKMNATHIEVIECERNGTPCRIIDLNLFFHWRETKRAIIMDTKFNFKSAICTSREQSERLLALGLKKETADMVYRSFGYIIDEFGNKERRFKQPIMVVEDWESKYDIPAWSLHRLLCLYGQDYEIKELYNSAEECYGMLITAIEIAIEDGDFNKEYLV